ncbi:MAG: hypothetical protein DRI57_20400 [Deltaproteobacteria bacterium]|nr:MAG: hypothetical protein DRI57_20400 [Deltaproteobacteria bacterium]
MGMRKLFFALCKRQSLSNVLFTCCHIGIASEPFLPKFPYTAALPAMSRYLQAFKKFVQDLNPHHIIEKRMFWSGK